MKISLNIEKQTGESTKATENRTLDHIIENAQKGDWEAKELLLQKFRPLIISLIEKRTREAGAYNKYFEAAREGLLTAANKYSRSIGPDRFKLFALDFIEKNMDRVEKGGGFLARLFGRK